MFLPAGQISLLTNVQSISSGDPSTARNSGSYGDGASESYFGRINFNWVDKYLFTV